VEWMAMQALRLRRGREVGQAGPNSGGGGGRHVLCLREGACAGLCRRPFIVALYHSALNLPFWAGLFIRLL
jgi:hypothetical protein